jgi:hypothetical protein
VAVSTPFSFPKLSVVESPRETETGLGRFGTATTRTMKIAFPTLHRAIVRCPLALGLLAPASCDVVAPRSPPQPPVRNQRGSLRQRIERWLRRCGRATWQAECALTGRRLDGWPLRAIPTLVTRLTVVREARPRLWAAAPGHHTAAALARSRGHRDRVIG